MTDQFLPAEMRSVADQLERFNRLYLHTLNAEWSPGELRRQAEWLEKNP